MDNKVTTVAREIPEVARATGGLGETGQKALLSGGSVLGGLAMSSCCIVPLVLFSLGVTGAWIGNFVALYPYKLYFLVPTAGFLAAGFHKVYRQPKASDAVAGRACGTPLSDRINKAALWFATILVVAALAFPYIAPLALGA